MSPRRLAVVCLAFALAACGSGEGQEKPASAATAEGTFSALAPDVYEPCGLQRAGDAVWVLGCSGTIVRVPRDDTAPPVRVGGDIAALDGLAGGEVDTVWTLLATGEGDARRGLLARIDPDTGTTLDRVALGSSIPADALVVRATLWVAATDGGLYAVDGGTARRVASGPPLTRVLADGDRMWTVAENGDVVERDVSGKPVRTFAGVSRNAIGAAAALGSVWLAAADSGVVRLDVESGTVSRVGVAGTVNAIEHCDGAIWLSQPDVGLRALDAHGRVTRELRLAIAPRYVACIEDRLVLVSEDGRIGTIAA